MDLLVTKNLSVIVGVHQGISIESSAI